MPKIQEQHEEETFNYSRPSLSLTLKKQQADEVETPRITKSDILYDKLGLPISPREDDVTVMHGSSEFMLVLYPEDEEKKVDDTTRKDLGITKYYLIGKEYSLQFYFSDMNWNYVNSP